MSRAIKFRVWDKRQKRLVAVQDLHWIHDGKYTLRVNASDNPGDYIPLLDGEYELVQFTGLHDKNGKEIYEGDIVGLHKPSNPYKDGSPTNIEKKSIKAVKWIGDGYGHVGFNIYPPRAKAGYEARNSYEVLGNIYETPELLK